MKLLEQKGICRTLAKKSLDIAQEKVAFTIFAVVDALTRLAGESLNAGNRLEADQKAVSVLSLATS